jgi:Spy/CpxP family protein refolding chaperone
MQRNFAKLLVLLLALASMSALAQGPQPPDPATMVQHRVNLLTAQLGLSSAQQQQATTIYTNSMNGLQPLHDQMKTAHQAIQAAVTQGNSAAIDQAANTIGSLTAQMAAAHAKADAQFFQILTADQQTKFTQLQSQHQGRGFGHGRGGPQGF